MPSQAGRSRGTSNRRTRSGAEKNSLGKLTFLFEHVRDVADGDEGEELASNSADVRRDSEVRFELSDLLFDEGE